MNIGIIIGRIGGDEFAVLAVDLPLSGMEAVLKRLDSNTEKHDLLLSRPWHLSISAGAVEFQAVGERRTIEQLLSMADAVLYTQKQRRKAK